MCVVRDSRGGRGPGSEARVRPKMTSEDALEDLPGDQLVESPTEQIDTDSSVGISGPLAAFFPSITTAPLSLSVNFLVHFL